MHLACFCERDLANFLVTTCNLDKEVAKFITWFTRRPLNLGIIGIDLVGSRPSAFWIRCAVVPLSA